MSCFLTQPAYSGSVCGCKWDLVFDWCSFSLGPGLHFLKADGWLWRGVVGCGATFVGRRGDGFQALLQMDVLELGLNHIIVTAPEKERRRGSLAEWSRFWKATIPLKARTIWWRALQGTIATGELRKRRWPQQQQSAACPICQHQNHLFFLRQI